MSSQHPISTLNTLNLLLSKYDCPINFYLAKPINHIIHNRTHEQSNLIAKDIAVFVQDLQYLKRYYHDKNGQGKNEIHDRMTLLINFYATANMLQYEYPNMVISNMQEMFKKRRKKLNLLKNKKQDQEDDNDDDDDSSDGSKDSKTSQKCIFNLQPHKQQQLLQDLEWSDIVNCYIPTEKEQKVQEQLQFDEECSIYDHQTKRTDSFFSKISKLTSELAFQMNFDAQQNEKEVSHLILDFDDLDREKVIFQYTKLTNKENIPLNTPKIQGLKQNIQSLNDKKPLSSSITIDTLRESNFNDRPTSTKQSMIARRDERDKQVNLVKKSSILQPSKKTFIFDEDMVINQNQCEESPLIDPANQLNFHPQEQKSRIFPPENARIFPPENTRIFPSQSKKPQGMKQSQIIYNDYFIKQKYQNRHVHDYKTELQRLKENPVQLDEILKIQTQYEHHPPPPSMVKQSSMDFHTHPPERPELPFYLKRVRTHEQPKPYPEDPTFLRFKKK